MFLNKLKIFYSVDTKVSYELRRLADRRLPNFEDEKTLASCVEEFTNCLMDPLKSDVKCRLQFKQCFEEVMETAIELEQKKVSDYQSFFRYLGQCAKRRS